MYNILKLILLLPNYPWEPLYFPRITSKTVITVQFSTYIPFASVPYRSIGIMRYIRNVLLYIYMHYTRWRTHSASCPHRYRRGEKVRENKMAEKLLLITVRV